MAKKERTTDIDVHLQNAILAFERDVRAQYASRREADVSWRLGTRIAEIILPAVIEPAGHLDGAESVELFNELGRHDLQKDLEWALQAKLARDLQPQFGGVSRRALDLVKISLRVEPTEPVRKFLRRISRCYLLDLQPETIVMCRAAFEVAINSRYRREGVEFPAETKPPFAKTMKARIESASGMGWLGSLRPNQLFSAVWLRGNKAAHEDPSAVGGAIESIALTVEAIKFLASPSAGSSRSDA